jgi:type IV secretion system protein TrbL
VLAALVFFWMGIFGPGIASGLITGAPQLGAGSAAGAAMGVAAGTYAAGMGARAAAGGVSTAVKAGASMAGAARTSYTMGAVASGGAGPAGIAAGLAGVARAGGDAIRRTVARPASAFRDAYRRGSESAWRATGGTTTGSSQSPHTSTAQSPGWARRMERGQRMSHAGQIAAHSLRDGDRGSGGAAPSLQDKDD